MKIEMLIIIGIFIGFILLEIIYTNFFRKKNQTLSDIIVEIVSTGTLIGLIQPIILVTSFSLCAFLIPDAQDLLENWSAWAVFGLFLIFDDMTQYWWHRTSHRVPWLYNLHRAHHNAEYLSIRVVYRNNLFYYFMMPGLWLSGALIYMGGGAVYAVYIALKMAIIFGAHCDVRWDEPLYKIKWLSPLMWIVERTISTPATHSAHHGKYASDLATHYKGNYGNLLFFWDVLFGTAHITREYPKDLGVENLPPISTRAQLLWPIFRSEQKQKVPSAAE
mgnify:CR=1 FL=1